MERRVSQLEKELKELKRSVKSLKRKKEEPKAAERSEKDVGEILEAVTHLSSNTDKEELDCTKRMCYFVFSRDELVTCSRTGKKTVKSGEVPKPALDSKKLNLLEKAVLMKCTKMSCESFKKRIDNIIKMERRCAKEKK